MQRGARAAADGVDQDVEPPEGRDGLVDDAVGVRLLRHVRRQHERLRARPLDRLARLLQPALVAADDRDVRAHAGERPADPHADPTGAARDQGRPPVQPEPAQLVHSLSFPAARRTASTILT